jgi:hypothetical protein
MKLSTLDLPDRQHALEEVKDELPEGVDVEELAHGYKAWSNPINGFRVLRVHYTVDPKRRSEEWRLAEKRKYGESEWNREQELMWESIEGKAVYGDFWDSQFHVSRTSLGWNPKLPVCRGWDFGLNGACVFGQLFPHTRLLILREAVSEDIAFERFVDEVHRLSNEWFPGARFVEFVDPSGRYRMGADERTYAMILANRPLNARQVLNGPLKIAARIKGVTDFLRENVRGLPAYLVDPSCDTLLKGFTGGYLYERDKKGVLKPEPEKNFFSHVHDANQYLCGGVRVAKLDYVSQFGKVKEAGCGGRTAPPPNW